MGPSSEPPLDTGYPNRKSRSGGPAAALRVATLKLTQTYDICLANFNAFRSTKRKTVVVKSSVSRRSAGFFMRLLISSSHSKRHSDSLTGIRAPQKARWARGPVHDHDVKSGMSNGPCDIRKNFGLVHAALCSPDMFRIVGTWVSQRVAASSVLSARLLLSPPNDMDAMGGCKSCASGAS